MLAFLDLPEYVEKLNKKSKEISSKIYQLVEDKMFYKEIKAHTNLVDSYASTLFYCKEGIYKLKKNNKLIRFFSSKDIINMNQFRERGFTIQSDFKTFGYFININDFLRLTDRDSRLTKLYSDFNTTQANILYNLCAINMSDAYKPRVNLRRYSKGEHIIKEGDDPSEIYLMIDGRAKVVVKNVVIGNINSSEIFGEFGFFIEQKRTASVVAETNCLINVLEKHEFSKLIKTRPEMMIKITKTLAKRVVDLNQEVVKKMT